MLVFQPWKSWTVIIACLLGIVFAVPNLFSAQTLDALPAWLPKHQIALGLDLQGGTHLVYQVDMDDVAKQRLSNVLDELRPQLIKEKVGYTNLSVEDGHLVLALRDAGDLDKVKPLLNSIDANLIATAQPNGLVTIDYSADSLRSRQSQIVEQSIGVVRKRIDALGTREPTIAREGDDRILVQLPGINDPERAKRIVGETAKLTFRLVDTTGDIAEAEKGHVPPGDDLLPVSAGPNARAGQQGAYLVHKRVMVEGSELEKASVGFRDNEPVILFTFNSIGAHRFADATTQNVGKPFAIVLDDKEILSAPNIREPITGGSGEISGSFTTQTAQDLSLMLNAGALPAKLTVIEERTVGPDLGADSIRAGTTACLIAVALVMVFMVLFYGLFGIFADVALFFNLCLLLSALSLLGATLTLPGIAGIALTMGMAVDANVLVNERIREESRQGRSLLGSIDAGFARAYATIIDANVTHLIAGGFLFFLGSGPVKGFAVTLCLGILSSLFTTIMVSRLFVVWWLRRRPKLLPI